MKNIYITLSLVLFSVLGLQAQDCATGYCPATITVHHFAGPVSAVDAVITYGVVETALTGSNKCWITRNLGATVGAASATDPSDAAAGWYWQFNRKQGYASSTVNRTPDIFWVNTIVESGDWLLANDPCRLLLGGTWRLPSSTDWTNADANGAWANSTDTYSSVLKLHAAGYLMRSTGDLITSDGCYWSSTTFSTNRSYLLWVLTIGSMMNTGNGDKANGYSVRCLRDL